MNNRGRKRPDISHFVGETFHRWTVVSVDHEIAGTVFCRCACGTEKSIKLSLIKSGLSKSCGCFRRYSIAQRNMRHGMADSREYSIWRAMIARCKYEGAKTYKNYGGRGISVCKAWAESFSAFYADMGACPAGHSIERIDVDGNYEAGNCTWIPMGDQSRNRRTNRKITFRGETMNLADWARRLDITHRSLMVRLDAWPLENALTVPKKLVARNEQ